MSRFGSTGLETLSNRSRGAGESKAVSGRKSVLGLPSLGSSRGPRRPPVPKELAHLSDEALVALVVRSDEVALAELYDRYGRAAYGLALRILRDEDLAQDAVQEAFLAVWRSAARFLPERAKASTWILTLVHRRAVDLVRREERRRAEPLGEELEAVAGSTEESAWLRLERERVQAALRQLPDQQREALELAYYGGFTQSELAERLGLPLGTIKSRMFAGLSRLRDILTEAAPEEPRWSPRESTN
jgi:RNA polymerase sigma-70 factor (ECF subfamily)